MTTPDILALAKARFGPRSTIARQEMADLLADYAKAGGEVANGYVGGTFREEYAEYPEDHPIAAGVKWATACAGSTVISVGNNLRDGGIRYDSPGGMAPCQMADVSFVEDAGIAVSTRSYLRDHCKRLYIVKAGTAASVPPPPILERHQALHAQWVDGKAAYDARTAEEARLFHETGNDNGLPASPAERAVERIVGWETWPRDPAEVDRAIERGLTRSRSPRP